MKVISKIIQWFFTVSFVMMALTAGSIASSIIIFIAALLMAPIKPIRQIFLNFKIKSFIVIILSLVLFFVGTAISPNMDASSDTVAGDDLVIEESTTSNIDEDVAESTTETTKESTTEENNSFLESTQDKITEIDTTENTTFESTTKKVEIITQKETTTNKESTTNRTETTTRKETTTKRETTTVDPESQITVYVTETGKRYHYENPCGNGKYYPSTLAKAKARGLTPCDKCVLH